MKRDTSSITAEIRSVIRSRGLPDGESLAEECVEAVRLWTEGIAQELLSSGSGERLSIDGESYAVLADLSAALERTSSLEDISELVLEQAKRITESPLGYVGHIDAESGTLVCTTMTRDIWDECQVKDKSIVFRHFGGLWGWVLEQKTPLLCNDVAADPRSSGTPAGHIAVRRFLSAPAMSENVLLGQVALANSSRPYTPRDLELVERLAAMYGLAIERLRSRECLEASEARFRDLFENAQVGMFRSRLDGTGLIDVNPKLCDILGYDRDELIGTPSSQYWADPEARSEMARQLRREGRVSDLEVRVTRKDGSIGTVLTSLSIGESSGVIQGSVVDITERMEVELTLAEYRQRLEEIVDLRTSELLEANALLTEEAGVRSAAEDALRMSLGILETVRFAQSVYLETLDARAFFTRVLTELLEVTSSEYGFVGEVLGDPPYLKTYAVTDISWDRESREFYRRHAPEGMEFRNLDTLFGAVMRSGEPVLANDPATDPRAGGLPPGHPPLRSFLGFPILNGERLVGMVGLANRPAGYDEELLELLSPLLRTCGSLIEAHRSEQRRRAAEGELSRNAEAQAALAALLRVSLQQLTVEELADRTLDLLFSISWLSVEQRGAIFLVEREPDVLVMKAQRGLERGVAAGCERVPFGACLCGRAAARKRLLFAESLDERHDRVYEGMEPHGHYCIPVISGHGIVGLITLYLSEGHRRDPAEEHFLENMAAAFAGIVERVRSAEALRQSEVKLRAILEQAPLLLWTTDRELNVTYLGGSGVGMLPHGPAELVGRNILQLIGDQIDATSLVAAHSSALEGKSACYELEVRDLCLAASVEPLIREDGTIDGTVGVAHDVADRRRAEEARVRAIEAEASAEAKSRFLSSMSHELRTPLNAILGFARVLQREIREDGHSARARYVANIASAGEHMLSLVDDLLEYHRLGGGAVDLEVSRVSVIDTLKGAALLLGPLVEERGHGLELEAAPDLPPLRTSRRALKQIVVNLLSNACKYTPEGGHIVLRARLDDGGRSVRIEVEDDGAGISSDDLDQLFTYWQRAGGKQQHNMKGSGIGLALVRSLVERLGGCVEVRSELGRGSCFAVVLPVEREET